MNILRTDPEAFAQTAAALIASVIRAKPDARLVVATGNTPIKPYQELAKLREQGELDCSSLRVFQMDAYADVSPQDPRSLQGWTRRSFIEPLHIPEKNFTPMVGNSSNHEAACTAYHQAVVEAGGYDLAILGLGPNGHLGFNEPPADAKATTRVIQLTEESIHSNAAHWGGRDQVPRQALTAGMDLFLSAKQLLLLVTIWVCDPCSALELSANRPPRHGTSRQSCASLKWLTDAPDHLDFSTIDAFICFCKPSQTQAFS
jgi:glucosamine-6-phosphate deaminase